MYHSNNKSIFITILHYFFFFPFFFLTDLIDELPVSLLAIVIAVERPTIFPKRNLLKIKKVTIAKTTHVIASTPISINKP